MKTTKKQEFEADYKNSLALFGEITQMIISVKLPTGAKEMIINTQDIPNKYQYYINAYDDDMKLKTCPSIQIVGCMFV